MPRTCSTVVPTVLAVVLLAAGPMFAASDARPEASDARRLFLVHVDCNGDCGDMSMLEACDSIEVMRGLDFELEPTGVSCVNGIPSTAGNRFVDCPVPAGGDNECRAFELGTLGDIPCVDGPGSDALVTCRQADLPGEVER